MQFVWISKAARQRKKREREKQWHRWFAVKPVKLGAIEERFVDSKDPGVTQYAFLETVYRRWTNYSTDSQYEHITKKEYFKKKLHNPNI